jgi:F-type H+-transporting ATPase subunit b
MQRKTLGILIGLTLLLVVMFPSIATAEEQTNPFVPPRFDLTIWTIVIFVLLFLVLRFVKLPGASAPAWVMMLQGLQKREQSIHQAINDAKKAREDAEAIRAQHRNELDKAKDEVRAIIEEGRRSAQQVADDLVSKAKSEAQAERDRLRREMDTARSQALRDLTGWAAQLATLISSKALGRQLNLDDHRRLVDESLTDMEKTGDERRKQQAGSVA